MYSQYIMNGFLVNPSFTGRDGFTTINLTIREQWIGLKEAPGTYAASFQTSLTRKRYTSRKNKLVRPSQAASRVGAGGYIFNDNNGIVRRTGFQADYAYHIPLGGSGKSDQRDLSFGLALIAYQYSLRTNELRYSYNDDPYFTAYDKSVFVTDFNFGASYATSKYYAGFAMTNMLRGSLIFGTNSENKRGELGHYFLTGGLNLPIDKNWVIKPSAFIKSSDMLFKSMQFDLTGRVFYKEDYWAGLSFRSNDAIIFMAGLKYQKFYLGYAFDFTITDIRNRSYGTMELTIGVKLGESAKRLLWLNSF
jgi:type IX secretion system PorP/SprF family membrane protein